MQGKTLQFDQWRIAHLAEFGITNLDGGPVRPRTPKAKRKEKTEREASERRSKTRRDSEPSPAPEAEERPEEAKRERESDNKENTKPNKFGSLFETLSCPKCGTGFSTLMEYIGHKKVCEHREHFDLNTEQKVNAKAGSPTKMPDPDSLNTSRQVPPEDNTGQTESVQEKVKSTSSILCQSCSSQFSTMVQYEKHRSICLHSKNR